MPVLEINNLVIDFETDQGVVEAIDHLTLSVREGEVPGVVGESGCGKTTVARSILGVIPQPPARLREGEIRFQGEDLLRLSEADLTARIRGKAVTVIPQDPLASLNPLFPVGVQPRDLLQWSRHHGTAAGAKANQAHIVNLLKAVQLPSPEAQLRKYPHEFSGGQRQRLLIAAALALIRPWSSLTSRRRRWM
jgi:peptide/nickel transport system ATP-binding protein